MDDQETTDDKATGAKATNDKTPDDQPTGAKATDDKTPDDQPTGAKATDDKAPDDKPTGDKTADGKAPQPDQRSAFYRDAALFHGKLLVDGLRDAILFPAALVAFLVDVLRREEPPGRYFYDVLHFGEQTEGWIDLFEAVDRAPKTDTPRPTIEGSTLDDLVDELEAKLRAGHEKGEISASFKKAIDPIVEAARKTLRR